MSVWEQKIVYHLYIEGIRDLQFEIDILCTDTFKAIILKILDQIKQSDLLKNWKSLAQCFPRERLLSNKHPLLCVIFAPKMTTGGMTIEEYTLELLETNDAHSIALNQRFREIIMAEHHCLFIIALADDNARYPETDSVHTVSTATTTQSTEPIAEQKQNQSHCHQPHEDRNQITETQSTQNKGTKKDKYTKKAKRAKEKKKSKTKKKQKTNKTKKRRKKSKPKVNRKRKRHQVDMFYDDDDEYVYSESSSYDDEWDFSSEEEPPQTDIESDEIISDEEEFVPPTKRRKIDYSNIGRKLRERNPSREYRLKRSAMNNNRFIIRIPRNRIRRQQNKTNHLIILLDASRSMQCSMVYDTNENDLDTVSRYDLCLKYIRKYIQNQWRTEEQNTTTISFATFGLILNVKADRLRYSTANVKKIMKVILQCKDFEGHNNTALYQAVYEAMERYQSSRSRYRNTRFLIFTDGENHNQRESYCEIKNYLKCNQVTVDCIHTTRRERANTALRDLCALYSNQGRYWNPLTLESWNVIFESIDFLYPHKRNRVFDLTLDDDDD